MLHGRYAARFWWVGFCYALVADVYDGEREGVGVRANVGWIF